MATDGQVYQAAYDDRFKSKYGYLRDEVLKNGDEYLKCGILNFGFARVYCDNCGHDFLLAFSCKKRICPSCMKKRQIEHGDFLVEEVLENVSHRHFVLSIPKRIRHCFFYRRDLLAKLSKIAYESVVELLKEEADVKDGYGASVNVIHTYGELLDWHPHIHMLISWGIFKEDGTYVGLPQIPVDTLRDLFMHKVLKMLIKEEAITCDVAEQIKSWPHSGFSPKGTSSLRSQRILDFQFDLLLGKEKTRMLGTIPNKRTGFSGKTWYRTRK